jgi:O-antigen/teichoic acid export membrane protein
VVASRLDLLLIQQWSTPAVVGVYALAVSLVSKAGILNSSLITVLLPSVSALKGRSEIWRYLRHGMPRSAIVALGFVAMVPIVGPFVGLVYGSTYAASVTLIKWLMVIAAFEIAVAPLMVLVYPLDKPRLAAQADGLRIGVLVALGVLLTPMIGPIGLVIARLFASVSGAGFVIVQLLRTGWIRPPAKAEIR